MPQRILPMLPAGSTEITDTLSVVNAEGHLSHFFCLEISLSGSIGKHIKNGVHIFRKERSSLGVI